MERIVKCLDNLKFLKTKLTDGAVSEEEKEKLNKFRESFVAHLDDDLNTADAISDIFEAVREINTNVSENATLGYVEYAYDFLRELCDVLGIIPERNDESVDEEKINELIEKRAQCKKNKDYSGADAIRNELLEMGIVLEDTREGTKWSKKQ